MDFRRRCAREGRDIFGAAVVVEWGFNTLRCSGFLWRIHLLGFAFVVGAAVLRTKFCCVKQSARAQWSMASIFVRFFDWTLPFGWCGLGEAGSDSVTDGSHAHPEGKQ